jgi:multidrug resistance efflux pump
VIRLYTDFNQPVKAGQVLAELDQALIRTSIAQIEAILK